MHRTVTHAGRSDRDTHVRMYLSGASSSAPRWRRPSPATPTLAAAVILVLIALTSAPCAFAAFGFSPLAPLSHDAGSGSHHNSAPALASDRHGTWVAVWQSSAPLTGDEPSEIVFSRSTDNAKTWSATAPVSSDARLDGESDVDPRLATDGNGTWVVVWLASGRATSNQRSAFRVARSVDNDRTWHTQRSFSTDCMQNGGSVATDGQGHWIVVFGSNSRSWTDGGDGDVYASFSQDNGATWNAPSTPSWASRSPRTPATPTTTAPSTPWTSSKS